MTHQILHDHFRNVYATDTASVEKMGTLIESRQFKFGDTFTVKRTIGQCYVFPVEGGEIMVHHLDVAVIPT